MKVTIPGARDTVVYAPFVGPIWGEERSLYFVGDAAPAGPQAFLFSILQATGTPET